MLTKSMLTKTGIAVALATILGSTSMALAAPRHHVTHRAPASAYSAFGAVGGTYSSGRPLRAPESGAALIQDRDYNESVVGIGLDGGR
jgi:hypothetical protein